MFQRVSLYCALSLLSPVCRANARVWPRTGPAAVSLTARTIASATWVVSISCGRYVDRSPADPLVPEPVHRLEAHRGLGVHGVHVGQVHEGQQGEPGDRSRGLGRRPEPGEHGRRLTGPFLEQGVAAEPGPSLDDGGAQGRAAEDRGAARGDGLPGKAHGTPRWRR